MKAIKFLSVAFIMAFSMNANAQFVKSGGGAAGTSAMGGEVTEDEAFYSGYGKDKDKRYTGEFNVYLGESWGLGVQGRREINQYFAYNYLGVSYLAADWDTPDLGGFVNFRLLGARGYTSSYRWVRGYVDLNLGYTLGYFDFGRSVETTHHFGLDFGVGIQLHKNVAIGYNMTYLSSYEYSEPGAIHYCKLSCIF